MKRFLRIFALVCACAMLCLSFASCDAIDEMRAARGFWNEDGSISYGGKTYMLLPECKELFPPINESDRVNITENDVPILLAEQFGTCFYKSLDGDFLWGGEYRENYGGEIVYCVSDRYDEIVARIEAGGELDGYCYSYYVYDDSFELVNMYYKLSRAEVDAVNATITDKEPIDMPSGSSLNSDFGVGIERCSDDLLFRSEAFTVWVCGDEYYITVYDMSDASTDYYKVASEHKEIFANIVSAYIENW